MTRIRYKVTGHTLTSNELINHEGKKLQVVIQRYVSENLYIVYVLNNSSVLCKYDSLALQAAKRLARKLLTETYGVRLNDEIRPRKQ